MEACRPKQIPVLIYRKNHRPWRVKIRAPMYVGKGVRVRADVTMSIEDFLVWFEEYLKIEIKGTD